MVPLVTSDCTRLILEFPGTGTSTNFCCDVSIRPDVIGCGSYTLNAIAYSASTPNSYQWYFNNSVIPGATNVLYEATQSEVYKVVGTCGLNTDTDEISVTIVPAIVPGTVADYVVCDDAVLDGLASFNLSNLNTQALGALPADEYTVTYHLTAEAAALGQGALDPAFTNTVPFDQTLYIRVTKGDLPTCYEVITVQLHVIAVPLGSFTYSANEYCNNIGTNPFATPDTGASLGTFTADSPNLFFVAGTTNGEIDLAQTLPGTYVITNTLIGTNGCPDVTATFTVTITAPVAADFHYPAEFYCSNGTETPAPIMDDANAAAVSSFTSDSGLILDAVTGIITINGSTVGTHTITNTIAAAGGCSQVVATTTITITQLPDASFTYNVNYCKDTDSDPTPLVTGVAGTFTINSTAVTIDPVSGKITLETAPTGSYIITNTVAAADGCGQVTATFTILISANGVADFSYVDGTYCKAANATASPTFTNNGTAGVFTFTPAGLVINAAGVVDLNLSAVGTYDVTNTINGTGNCTGDVATATIIIVEQLVGQISYNGQLSVNL
ncbi:hypothetical protein [Flavobacterium sp. 3HN19-14]|uniref:hypothetical protein n=1 Tax=Flavobacterium sp. 3HN19-14 TaxID=3448133 RepID=UPI003EE3CF16